MTVLRISRGARFGVRAQPERVVLGVREGVTPSPRPPVRIYLGTEPAQHRAERAFVWSVEQVRDPARIYEIHLMKELAGFRRIGWLTGFTNYRFAIPHFAGSAGRALYNDVDQVYLRDPAELFDGEMNGHGILAIAPDGRLDTSVMLIDCARMAAIWPLSDAQTRRKNALLARARAQPGLIGPLDPAWNARDGEYVEGKSKLLHYTTLHLQPWRPFPERYVYQRNAVGQIWHDLERSADMAAYQIFGFEQPSRYYRDLVDRLRQLGNQPTGEAPALGPALDGLIARTGARSLLHFGLGAARNAADPMLGDGIQITRHDAATAASAEVPRGPFDGVVCTGGLQYLPDGELRWVLEELFRRARRFLLFQVSDTARARALPDGAAVPVPARGPAWWFAQIEEIGARYPQVHWRLELRRGGNGTSQTYLRDGGRRLDGPPRVWILTDGKPGHTTQSIGLAEALGWPFQVKDLEFTALAGLGNLLLGRLGATRLGLRRGAGATLAPPWPNVVIATGWRPAPVVRWIGRQSRGRTRLIQMGRKGGRVAELYDIVVSCRYFRLPFHPRRIETTAPLNRVSARRLAEAGERWRGLFDDAAKPHIVLLVGGTSRRHRMPVQAARRMAEALRGFAEAAGGTVFAVTSRRTGEAATAAIAEGLGASGRVLPWQSAQADNPYLGYLALADVLVVTGDSESMLAEATAAGKPVYIYPIQERPGGPLVRLQDWISARAHARRLNRRGTVRPQRGLDRLCARLIARGYVQPRRDVNILHETLYELGIARPFGAPLETAARPPLRETGQVAEAVRGLLGLTGC